MMFSSDTDLLDKIHQLWIETREISEIFSNYLQQKSVRQSREKTELGKN